MTVEWAYATPVAKPWGKVDLRPWSELGGSGEAIGEIRFERMGRDAARPALLLKLLFTAEALSIQVHPDDALASAMGLQNGKSEAWYVLDARPGAEVGLGLLRTLNNQALRAAVEDGGMVGLVNWVGVRPGDFLSVPAGTIHALGGGMVVAEVQQNSDATFRLFDYGRPRPLHLDEAIAASHAGPRPPQAAPRQLGANRTLLGDLPCFVVEALDLAPGTDWRLHARQETWLLIIGGGACCAGREARCGEALLVEAATVNIFAGLDGLRALVAYPGPLQDRLLEAGAADLSPQPCGADAAGLAA